MTEPLFHLPPGQRPVVPWSHRPPSGGRKMDETLPEVWVIVGRDNKSSGLTIVSWEPTDGQWPRFRTLYAARWLEPILTTEGALRHAANGAVAAVDELFGPELPS